MGTFVKNNRLFGAFFCLSLFIHYIAINEAPLGRLFKVDATMLDDYPEKEYTVELELESPPEPSNIAEEEEVEEPLHENKVPSFVDTSDNPFEEEPQGDTDKIGVKSAAARDTYEGEEEHNDQPHSEGHSTGLFLTKGDAPFTETSPGNAEEQNEAMESPNAPPQEPQPERNEEAENHLNDTGPDTSSEMKGTGEEEGDASEERDGAEEKVEGEEEVEVAEAEDTPDLLTQLKTEVSATMPTDPPLELEEIGEIVPTFTPRQKQEQEQRMPPGAEAVIKRIVPSMQEETKTSQRKIVRRVTRKGSSIIYEDTFSNAPLSGEESFSVDRHEYAEYFQHIRDKIGWYWFLSDGHNHAIKLETANQSPIKIEFKILPSGMTGDVRTIDDAGNLHLASLIQDAIKGARLDRFPPYMMDEEFIGVIFSFYFF